MAYKVGQIFYWCSSDSTTGKVEFEEYHVRTIRGGFVHAIWKTSFTWGKRSTKNGDFGWLPNVPAWCRKKWRVDADASGVPDNLKTTKLAAIRHELKTLNVRDFDTEEAYRKAEKTLKSMETRARTKR